MNLRPVPCGTGPGPALRKSATVSPRQYWPSPTRQANCLPWSAWSKWRTEWWCRSWSGRPCWRSWATATSTGSHPTSAASMWPCSTVKIVSDRWRLTPCASLASSPATSSTSRCNNDLRSPVKPGMTPSVTFHRSFLSATLPSFPALTGNLCTCLWFIFPRNGVVQRHRTGGGRRRSGCWSGRSIRCCESIPRAASS